jgi:hypothetical protein
MQPTATVMMPRPMDMARISKVMDLELSTAAVVHY